MGFLGLLSELEREALLHQISKEKRELMKEGKCPTCLGVGKVARSSFEWVWSTDHEWVKECPGCDGSGKYKEQE